MLIQDYVYVGAPVAAVRRRLAAGAEAWLTPIAVRAGDAGDALRVRIGPAGDLRLLSHVVRVTVGAATESGDSVVVPLTWQADGHDGAFPVLRAELEAAPLGEAETQLILAGRYEPPLGGLGARLDRLVLHRVAQASVRSFLEGVGATLEDAAERDRSRTG